jgi:hypothetical protein
MGDREKERRHGRIGRALPYGLLVPVALLLGLAPFRPEPHLVEKIRMLLSGTLYRPIDIFDLVLHGSPLVLLVVRAAVDGAALVRRKKPGAIPPA